MALFLAAVCGAAGLAFLLYGVTARPYTEIEAQLAFQAARIQHHLPLYVDPSAGAWEAGAPPSRFNVLYPPLWVEFLAHVSPGSLAGTRTVGRMVSIGLFVLTLAALVRGARTENRTAVLTGALLTLGLDLIVREVGLAQADIPAITLSTLGLLRANQKGRIDTPAAAMLASAPFVKHSVVGVTVGAFVAHILLHRKSGARIPGEPLLVAGIVALSFGGLYHFASGGVWLAHILRATGQSFSFERWKHEVGSRILLLGLPHAFVLFLAIKRRANLLATLPFATSLAWTLFTLAKYGSATHYWLEPSLAGLIALGAMPVASVPWRGQSWVGVPLAIAVAISGGRAFVEAPTTYADWQPMLDTLRRTCPLSPGEVVMSSDVRIEVEINGRVIVPAWESSHMARSGKFPLAAWREDMLRPEVRCLVLDGGFFDPLPNGPTRDNIDAYRRELRESVEANFVADVRTGPFLVFQRRCSGKAKC